MAEFTISSTELLGLCSTIGIIWGTYKIYKEWKKPSDDLKKKVEQHDTFFANDKKRIDSIDESNKILCKSMLVLINHEITGNGIDKMKQARDELQEYLIER